MVECGVMTPHQTNCVVSWLHSFRGQSGAVLLIFFFFGLLGVTAFIGATMFEIGSVLLMIEAFNENRAGCFGWQFERLFLSESNGSKQDLDTEQGKAIRLKPDMDHCTHHHPNRMNLAGKSTTPGSFLPPLSQQKRTDMRNTSSGRAEKAAIQADSETKDENSVSGSTDRSWVWFPTMDELRAHYLREIGFLACFSQFIGYVSQPLDFRSYPTSAFSLLC